MGKYLAADLLETVDTRLVGRVLYQRFAGFWPAMENNKDVPTELVDFAKWMNNTRKIVFQKTLKNVEKLRKGESVIKKIAVILKLKNVMLITEEVVCKRSQSAYATGIIKRN